MPEQPIAKGPVVLIILDGWGMAPESESNPINQVELPTFKRLFNESQHCRLWAHGEYVGLPKDQDGNSEAGHLNLGAGRIVKQDPVIISDSIKDGTFFKNPAFSEAIQHVKRNNSAIHLIGMLSDGQSAHSTPQHIYALLDLMDQSKVEKVFIHLFTDGRDSSPYSAKSMIKELEERMKPNQKIATIMGRFWGMDRKKEWSRTKKAYDALVLGKGEPAQSVENILGSSYKKDITDEFIEPHIIIERGMPIGEIKDNDSIIFFNHRSDRTRQLTKPFVQKNFQEANKGSFAPEQLPKNVRFVAMTDFGPDLGDIITAYPSIDVNETLPMALDNKKQLYIAESEKFAHISYFFNGGYDHSVGGEERVMISSPQVDSYAQTPAMSTEEITKTIIGSIQNDKHNFIAANFACLDMVAHTGDMEVAKKSLIEVDKYLGLILVELEKKNGALIVTADHGNIEEMKDLSTKEIDTEHSKNQVPFLMWCPTCLLTKLKDEGILADVAPTVLSLFGIKKPKEMTGNSLFK